jgi:hypothetical protein
MLEALNPRDFKVVPTVLINDNLCGTGIYPCPFLRVRLNFLILRKSSSLPSFLVFFRSFEQDADYHGTSYAMFKQKILRNSAVVPLYIRYSTHCIPVTLI